MPYRRLPKTDRARLKALQKAVAQAEEAEYNNQAIHYRTLTEAQRLLLQYENQVAQYKANLDSKVSANKQYRHKVHNARMYISHFIQVLNLAVIRGEIKRTQKELYKLSPDNDTLPDLSTEESLLQWGQNIIDGEKQRTDLGGFPIYNPTINKVQVHYDIFKEQYTNHQLHKKAHSRVYGDTETMRKQIDILLLDIWNQVEAFYRNELPYARLCKCQAYGLVYYYRRGEALLTAKTDQQIIDNKAQQPTLQWSETDK